MGNCKSYSTDDLEEEERIVQGNQEGDLENLMASSGASGPPREGPAIQWLMQHLTTMELAPGYVKRAIKEHQEMSFKLHEKERELKQMQERCECFLVSHSYFSAVWKSKGSVSQLVIAFIEIAM